MRRIAMILPVTLTLVLGTVAGCGDDKKVDTITDSPEAIKSDDATRKAMEDSMKSKAQSKAPNKAK